MTLNNLKIHSVKSATKKKKNNSQLINKSFSFSFTDKQCKFLHKMFAYKFLTVLFALSIQILITNRFH